MKLSVIIPTYNRKNLLRKSLLSLENQYSILSSNIEIIIVDDGSTDGTERNVKEIRENANGNLFNIKYFKQKNKGPAAARNLGIKNANGDILLFIGDDIISCPSLLEEHLMRHERNPESNVAVLGYATWSPEVRITPFMKWLEKGGPQFKYHTIDDKNNVPWTFFYTANISLKRQFLLNNGFFDESFPYAAYEDIELGFRLNKKGLRIIYNDKAVGYHYHFTSLSNSLRRMEKAGESLRIYNLKTGISKSGYKETPLLNKIISYLKFNIYKLIGCTFENYLILPAVYSYLMDWSRRKGYLKK